MRSARISLVVSVCLGSIACGASAPPAVAEPRRPEDALISEKLDSEAAVARAIREHYTKYEYRIPMRDGVKLFTVAYVPKDATHTYPILLERTPYGVAPYGADNYPTEKNERAVRKLAPSAAFVREGYVFVHQDVRGRMMSEGTFVDVRPHAGAGAAKSTAIDESTDAWDTIDWLVKNVPANNGRVGTWGISYPGFYAAQSAVDAHPALKAVSPQAPVTEWFLGDDFHHNGAFFLADGFDFYASFGKPRPKPTKKTTWGFDHDVADVYDYFLALGPVANANKRYVESGITGGIPFWTEMTSHASRDDWWKARDPRPFYKNAKPAILTVGGWFDAEDLFGTLETYRAFEKQSPGAENTLVMGPWGHGGWARTEGDHLGDVTFGQKTSQHFVDEIELPFFRRHLKGAGKTDDHKAEAFVFETGTNVWQTYSAWPPREAKKATLYAHAHGALGATPPALGEDQDGFDAYVSDPAKPVPYRAKTGASIDEDYMSDDQRFASRRPDVVTFATGEVDADVSLAGPIEAKLYVSTTGTDADFIVKLIDGYPQDYADPDPNPRGVHMGGYQQLVRAEVMRGKFRNGFDKPEPFEPGKPGLVHFTLPDVAHTFRVGHRIIVEVQSSWFPLVDRNPQTFTDIYKATEADFHAATQRIYRTADKPSSIDVMLLRGALPR
jgi:putative CocE/NonD family hydrolase